MVVDDVENHGEAQTVRRIDEPAEIVGTPVQTRRREQIDAVVAPAEATFKFGNGHDLDHRDADSCQLLELARGRRPRAKPRERPHVQLVRDLSSQRRTGPVVVGPPKRERIDDFRRPVRPLGLKPRRRIRQQAIGRVQPQLVPRAWRCLRTSSAFSTTGNGPRRSLSSCAPSPASSSLSPAPA